MRLRGFPLRAWLVVFRVVLLAVLLAALLASLDLAGRPVLLKARPPLEGPVPWGPASVRCSPRP